MADIVPPIPAETGSTESIESLEPAVKITDSHLFNVSLRGWLTTLILATLCYLVIKVSGFDKKIPDQFWGLVMLVSGYYFGQKQNQKEK